MSTIYDSLIEYSSGEAYPFHMPGHKRQLKGDVLSDVSRIDITEIDGFDNLHDPEGMIDNAQNHAAKLYGAEESFFLINGSTCGILSAISSCVPRGGWLMMARNCHKAVYHAAVLGDLKTVYIQPRKKNKFSFCEGITLSEIKTEVENFYRENPDAQIGALILTSPTYEGIFSDIKEIAGYLHEKNIPLIVDEAHGAHLGLSEKVPRNSCQCGADLVIHSLHKTLPAMTQTAILHVNGNLVDRQRLRRYLSIYQSSSPSYVLMASIERAMIMMEEKGEEYFTKFFEQRNKLTEALRQCKWITFYEGSDADPCKLVFSTKGSVWTGKELYDKLRLHYQLQMEMAAGDYVVAILTVMDSQEAFGRLQEAICKLDEALDAEMQMHCLCSRNVEESKEGIGELAINSLPKVKYTISEALDFPYEMVDYHGASGKVCAEFLYVYPPGIPILAPGERVEDKHIFLFEEILKRKLDLKGMKDNQVKVLVGL